MLHSNTSLPEGLDALMAESDFLKLVSLWLMMNMLPVHQGRHHVAKAGNTTTGGGLSSRTTRPTLLKHRILEESDASKAALAGPGFSANEAAACAARECTKKARNSTA